MQTSPATPVKNILVLGSTGLLGNAMLRFLSSDPTLNVHGTARAANASQYFKIAIGEHLITGIDILDPATRSRLFTEFKPDAVINCVGLIKQRDGAENPEHAVPINSELPHALAALCQTHGARLIHISTDCVFAGTKGNYSESDIPDATDVYGQTKLQGEVDAPHAITLRTSIIGHELSGTRGLLNWFLAQQGTVKGFTRAVFSGLPTMELARVVKDYVLPHPTLHGLYHVAAQPIDKYSLLKLFAEAYNKDITIVPSDELVIDRSLNADKFRAATGYIAPAWPELVKQMAEQG